MGFFFYSFQTQSLKRHHEPLKIFLLSFKSRCYFFFKLTLFAIYKLLLFPHHFFNTLNSSYTLQSSKQNPLDPHFSCSCFWSMSTNASSEFPKNLKKENQLQTNMSLDTETSRTSKWKENSYHTQNHSLVSALCGSFFVFLFFFFNTTQPLKPFSWGEAAAFTR